jgi:hypothetical protein
MWQVRSYLEKLFSGLSLNNEFRATGRDLLADSNRNWQLSREGTIVLDSKGEKAIGLHN